MRDAGGPKTETNRVERRLDDLLAFLHVPTDGVAIAMDLQACLDPANVHHHGRRWFEEHRSCSKVEAWRGASRMATPWRHGET